MASNYGCGTAGCRRARRASAAIFTSWSPCAYRRNSARTSVHIGRNSAPFLVSIHVRLQARNSSSRFPPTMNSPSNERGDDSPVIEPNLDAVYTLDVVAQLTGVSLQTVLFYHEQGLVPAVKVTAAEERYFDDDALRAIRRLEHLRTELELKEPALKLMVNLLAEIERLREAARSGR